MLISSQAELDSFHDAHFGQAATKHFSTTFLPSHEKQDVAPVGHFQEEDVYNQDEEQEDDGLGYYEDGVKRTLTDEQIAMFRHSELEALRRAQESQDVKSAAASASAHMTNKSEPRADAEPGELPSEEDLPSEAAKATSKKKKRRQPKRRVDLEKPDLRKRTWDVVDAGLASLDYGDESPESTVLRPTQRRHIFYDD
jgi:hypothetical protein